MTRFTPLWLQAGHYAASVDRRLVGAIWPVAATAGLALAPVPNTMDIEIQPGMAVLPAPNGTGAVLCVSDATETVTVPPAPPAGLVRRDRIWVQARGADLGVEGGEDWHFGVTTGNPGEGSSTPNEIPYGALRIAAFTLAGGQATLDSTTVEDQRPGGLDRNEWLSKFQAGGDLSGPLSDARVVGWRGRPLSPDMANDPGARRVPMWFPDSQGLWRWSPQLISTAMLASGVRLVPGGNGEVTIGPAVPRGYAANVPGNFGFDLSQYDTFWLGLTGDLAIGWPNVPEGYPSGSRALVRLYGNAVNNVTWAHMFVSSSAAQLPTRPFSAGWGSTLVGFIYDGGRLPGAGWPYGTFVCVAVSEYANA